MFNLNILKSALHQCFEVSCISFCVTDSFKDDHNYINVLKEKASQFFQAWNRSTFPRRPHRPASCCHLPLAQKSISPFKPSHVNQSETLACQPHSLIGCPSRKWILCSISPCLARRFSSQYLMTFWRSWKNGTEEQRTALVIIRYSRALHQSILLKMSKASQHRAWHSNQQQ